MSTHACARLAVISDLHSNLPALEAVLKDIRNMGAEQIVCAGDIPNPLPQSLEVWQLLKDRRIPITRGNHEDYIAGYHFGPNREKYEAPNFKPVRLVAEHLGREVAREFSELPFSWSIQGPDGRNVYVCHASPHSNFVSYKDGIDEAMTASLASVDASVIINGHRHDPWHSRHQDKLLISSGSLGLPFRGKPEAEYVLLTFEHGEWNFEHRFVPYDHQETVRMYRESGWIERGGPVAWLLHDEFSRFESRMGVLFRWLAKNGLHPVTEADWENQIIAFLKSIGRWDAVSEEFGCG